MKDHSRLNRYISRLNEELGKVKGIFNDKGKIMPPTMVGKHFDELQKILNYWAIGHSPIDLIHCPWQLA